MNTKIKSIIFDYDGVISLLQDRNCIAKICKILNISEEEYKSVYLQYRQDYDSGMISASDYWNLIIKNTNYNAGNSNVKTASLISDVNFQRIIRYDSISWTKINREALKIIKKLYNKNYKLAIVSNMTFDTLLLIRKAKWMNYFKTKIFSCEQKTSKPNEKIYKILMNELHEKPEVMLFIDDSEQNIDAARKLGINAIHYKNNNEMVKVMNERFEILI